MSIKLVINVVALLSIALGWARLHNQHPEIGSYWDLIVEFWWVYLASVAFMVVLQLVLNWDDYRIEIDSRRDEDL